MSLSLEKDLVSPTVSSCVDDLAASDDECCKNTIFGLKGGDDISKLVMEAVQCVSFGEDKAREDREKLLKVNRSFGNTSREDDILAKDEHTGALAEVLTIRAPPLVWNDGNEGDSNIKSSKSYTSESQAIQSWIQDVNQVLKCKIGKQLEKSSSLSPGKIRIFGRLTVPKKFNAEMDATHQKVEYLMPADFLLCDEGTRPICSSFIQPSSSLKDSLPLFFDSLPSFPPSSKTYYAPKSERKDDGVVRDSNGDIKHTRPSVETLQYFYKLKKLMQKMTTQIVELDLEDEEAVLAKTFHENKRKKQRSGKKRNIRISKIEQQSKDSNDIIKLDHDSESKNENFSQRNNVKLKRNVLQRRRFHNFTPRLMAHDNLVMKITEFLAYRRMDRFYHKSTIRFHHFPDRSDSNSTHSNVQRPYFVLSLTGDRFLSGQARAVFGLFIAIVRGLIHEDIIDCIFDEKYTNLVPCPMVPRLGLYASEVSYMAWEGKMKSILNARLCERYEKGWGCQKTIDPVDNFQSELHQDIAKIWCGQGVHKSTSRLKSESLWVKQFLEPWSHRARLQLEDYRSWKNLQNCCSSLNCELKGIVNISPNFDSINPLVPQSFERILYLLKKADSSGLWPSTTPKRQLVMTSSSKNGIENDLSLTAACLQAKSNKLIRSCAYSFKEGEGGASGSFSVGAMPGQCQQPKANTLFPELMRAAFELEMILCPEREPSSTIAVNRNAQFRPHVDNGAGSGQSESLIVGLGTYTGGELMVEGEKKDIRYKAFQFNGWTQRHWTLPFCGERFSLVWFTPKGCGGIHGIDLCKKLKL